MDTSEALVTTAEGMALGTVPLMPASLSCAFLMDGGQGKDGEWFAVTEDGKKAGVKSGKKAAGESERNSETEASVE